jgi:DNA-binding CsgD family transcriptional regulator
VSIVVQVVQSAGLPSLRGRDTELAKIEDWMAGSPDGGQRVLLVEGDAGIGKTRVLETLSRHAEDRGFAVFAGRADEVERARPFGPLVEAFLAGDRDEGPGRPELVAMLDATAPASGDPGLQFRVVDGFVDLVESIALERPALLVVDDLHWADPSTILTLNSMVRRLDYLDVRLAAGMRPVPRSPELARFLDAALGRGADHLTLASLGEEAVAELVADLVGAPPGPTLTAAVAAAAGNPLFITELVRAIGQESGIEISEGTAETDDATVPPSVRLTILRRLAFLGDEALELLRHASLLGSAFTLREMAMVMDTPIPTLAKIVDEPVRAGLIEERDGTLRFRHDLIREAIYGDMLEDVRADSHLRAARRLERAGAPSLQVAEQLMLGARPGDTAAVSRLHEAAGAVALQAPSVAVDLLEQALGLLVEPGETRTAILSDLVHALLWSGRPGDAALRAAEGLAVADTDLEASFRLGLVKALTAQGRFGDLIEEVDRVLAAGEPTPDLAAQLQAEAANAALFVGSLDEAARRAEEAVAAGTPAGSEGAVTGLLVLSDVVRGRGAYDEALQFAEEASLRYRGRASIRGGWGPEFFVAMALLGLDRFAEADQAIQRGRRADELLGRVSYLPVYGYIAASGKYAEGRWDEAIAEAESGLALADEVGLMLLRHWPNGILTLIALHRGDLAGAAARLAASGDYRDGPEDSGPEPVLLARARGLIQEATGDGRGALETLRGAFLAHVDRGMVGASRAFGPDLVRLALAHGEEGLASSVADSMEDSAERAPVPSVLALALLCRGLVDRDPDTLLKSVAAYEASPRRFDTALAAEAAAEALADAGRTAEAREQFERALRELEDIGADRHVGRVLGTMRRLGMGRRRRSHHAKASYGWEALTPSEVEVVRLVAEGLTNREIGDRLYISPRTVQTHLSHAFRKLNITSRVQLAAEVARRAP